MSVYDKYEIVIGLEVHSQLSTQSKMYCGDINEFGGSPNTHISAITLAHPGTLPKVNKEAITYAIKMGIATNCSITKYNGFARKNYFYADLPKGYQITQDKTPICTEGNISIKIDDKEKEIGITRIHLEEDAGKSIHDLDPFNSLIDLNRAGTPLIEIVSEPDLRSAEEAYAYLQEVRKLVRYLDICDGNMEEGSLRCDANVSVRLKGAEKLGQRAEVKNLNSFKNVMKAIEFEAKRQIDLIEQGKTISQETRSYDAVNNNTFSLRSKEHSHDYRYFPEPDLPPVILKDEVINEIKQSMPKLPTQLFMEYVEDLKLSEYDANILSEDREISNYFNEIISYTKNYKAAANWIIGPIKSFLNERAISITSFPLSAKTISKVIHLVNDGKFSFSAASNKLFPELINQPSSDVLKLAEKLNIIQNSDSSELEVIIQEILLKFPEKVEEYKNGKRGLIGMFMGEIMKRTKGKADPKLSNKLLQEKLNS